MSRGGYALFHDSPKRPLKVEGACRGHRERLRRQCIQSCGFLRLGKPGERAPKIVYALSIEVSDGNTRARTTPRDSVWGDGRRDFIDLGIVRRSWQRVDARVVLRDSLDVGHADGRSLGVRGTNVGTVRSICSRARGLKRNTNMVHFPDSRNRESQI